MMETERLRLLDTFTDGEGEQTTVYGNVINLRRFNIS